MCTINTPVRWVLLVEDDHLVGQALRRTIERGAGLRVRCARAPGMVWEALQQEPVPPVAAVLDHDLGHTRTTGLHLLFDLRRRLPRLPCALHSGCSPEALVEAFYSHGIGVASEPVLCFWKPDGAGALVDWLRKLAGGGGRDPPTA